MLINTTDKDLVLLEMTRISSKAMFLQAIMTLITGIILLALKAFLRQQYLVWNGSADTYSDHQPEAH